MDKYVVTGKARTDFLKYLYKQLELSEELKNRDYWKGYAHATERVIENFLAWTKNDFDLIQKDKI